MGGNAFTESVPFPLDHAQNGPHLFRIQNKRSSDCWLSTASLPLYLCLCGWISKPGHCQEIRNMKTIIGVFGRALDVTVQWFPNFSNGGSLAKSRFSQDSQCEILRSALCEIETAKDFLCRDR